MKKIRAEILSVCKRLHGRNLLASADGNVSYRLSDREILITPAGVNKVSLKASELASMNLKGNILKGQPSSERLMHLEIFRLCPKAKAIVHAHPPTAIAWTIAQPKLKELPAECLSELILAIGRVPIAPFARPGTSDMGAVLAPLLPQCRVILLARHGAVSWGESLEEAYNGMERLEHVAQILKSAHELGGLTSLPTSEVEALWELRRKLGERIL